MTTMWKSVQGWEGFYEVSDFGIVRSIDRVIQTKLGPKVFLGVALSAKISSKNGYVRVNLSAPGRRECRYVHEIVLTAFKGPCPNGMEGCHFDDDSSNNALTNLRWDYPIGNKADAKRNGLLRPCRGVDNGNAKLSNSDAEFIRASSLSQRQLGRMFDVSHSRIGAIMRGESYKE